MPGPKHAYKLMSKSPNPSGTCLCSPTGRIMDCKPPYVVFHAAELHDVRNPYAVACMDCVRGAVKKYDPQAFSAKTVEVEVEKPVSLERALDVIAALR